MTSSFASGASDPLLLPTGGPDCCRFLRPSRSYELHVRARRYEFTRHLSPLCASHRHGRPGSVGYARASNRKNCIHTLRSHRVLVFCVNWCAVQTLIGLLLGCFHAFRPSVAIGSELLVFTLGLLGLILQGRPSPEQIVDPRPFKNGPLSTPELVILGSLCLVGLFLIVCLITSPITDYDFSLVPRAIYGSVGSNRVVHIDRRLQRSHPQSCSCLWIPIRLGDHRRSIHLGHSERCH